MRSSRWTMVTVGVIALLVVTTVASASPPPTAPGDVLDDRFVNDDRQETIQASVAGRLLMVKNTNSGASATAVYGRTATGSAIYGNSPGGYGLYGYSKRGNAVVGKSGRKTAGVFTSNRGYGIRVKAKGERIFDHAGYFTSNWGWGIYVKSEHNQAVRGEAGTLSSMSMPGGAWGVVGIGDAGGTWGSSWDNWGVYGDSHNYRGVQGNTGRSDRNYGLFTYDNLYSLNYHTSGAVMQIVQNGGGEVLEPGDVAVFSGISASRRELGAPIIQVAKAASADSTAVAGVVYRRINIEALAEDAKANLEVTSEGPVKPGEYLLLVVLGPAQVKASALAGTIQSGDLLSTAGRAGYATRAAEVSVEDFSTPLPGTVFGKALEPLAEGQGLIYVFVTLQ